MTATAPIYEKIVHEDTAKLIQLRLVVNEFREKEYVHIRKYYMDYEGEWLPSKEGISFPLDFSNLYNLLAGISDITTEAEKALIKYDQ